MSATLKNLVLKTVSVGSVKLLAPANRIGSGKATCHFPTANTLSHGQFLPWPSTQTTYCDSDEELPPGSQETQSLSRQPVAAKRWMQSVAIPASLVGGLPSWNRCESRSDRGKHEMSDHHQAR